MRSKVYTQSHDVFRPLPFLLTINISCSKLEVSNIDDVDNDILENILDAVVTYLLGGRADSPGKPEDKENFAQLLREMRPVFDGHGLLLTAAVSAGKNTIDKAYEVPTMSQTLDFINVMTYDFHGW